jgi:cytochrome bd-type quinol oxidase subunit 2
MLLIALVGLPIILGYTFAVYRVFRGPSQLSNY